ncbi:MAG: tetratricopeptide repeat protein [Spirochaetales bacterium]|nr:tetratricopeptide repeat protein [Spirochaetales bacterium]
MKLKIAAAVPVLPAVIISLLFSGCVTPFKGGPGEGDPEKGAIGIVERPEENTYSNIEKLIADGDQDSAVKEFEKINNDDSETVLAYAGLLMSAGEYQRATDQLIGLLEREPYNADAYFNLALVMGLQDLSDEQIEFLEKSIAIDPHHSGALSIRGSIYLSDSKLKKASEYFERALDSDPDNIIALTGYGSALIRQEEYERAEVYLDRAVELDPANPFTYLDRSGVRAANDDMQGAEEDLSSAIELEPDYFWHYIDRGRLRIRDRGDRTGALEDFNRAIELNPENFYPYVFRGGIYDEMKELEKASEDYKKVIEMKPDYYFTYSALGIVQFMLGEWDASRKSFEKAFKYEPKEFAFLAMAAVAEMKKGDAAATKKYCSKAIDKIPAGNIYAHILRSFKESGYDAYVLRLIQEEKDKIVQKRLLFYIAELYHENGMETAAYSYFALVRDASDYGLWESRISAFELENHYE